MNSKRNLFEELKQSIHEMKQHKAGRVTLRTHPMEVPKKLTVSAHAIKETRRKLHLSQNVFSRLFRVSKRTLEKWEQGETKPNEQAAALILLVKKNPALLEQLSRL